MKTLRFTAGAWEPTKCHARADFAYPADPLTQAVWALGGPANFPYMREVHKVAAGSVVLLPRLIADWAVTLGFAAFAP